MWGESRSPVFIPGLKGAHARDGARGHGHPPWEAGMCFMFGNLPISFRYVVKPGGDDMYYFYYDAAT